MKGKLQITRHYRLECASEGCAAVIEGDVVVEGDAPGMGIIRTLRRAGWVMLDLAHHRWLCAACSAARVNRIMEKEKENLAERARITKMREEELLDFSEIDKRLGKYSGYSGSRYLQHLDTRKANGEAGVNTKRAAATKAVLQRMAKQRMELVGTLTRHAQEELIHLIDDERMTYADAAQKFGISLVALRARYRRAKARKKERP